MIGLDQPIQPVYREIVQLANLLGVKLSELATPWICVVDPVWTVSVNGGGAIDLPLGSEWRAYEIVKDVSCAEAVIWCKGRFAARLLPFQGTSVTYRQAFFGRHRENFIIAINSRIAQEATSRAITGP